jgi:hypothetical protein
MRNRVWTRRSALVAGVGVLIALAGSTTWLLSQGPRGAEIANVFDLPLTVAGLATTLFGTLMRREATDPRVMVTAADTIAARVAEGEAALQQRILADTGDVRPADVGFAQPGPAPVPWRTDSGEREGSLAAITTFFQSLQRGRLVILGDPGAGKTVLAVQLSLELARSWRPPQQADIRVREPVPVRLSLPTLAPTLRSVAADHSRSPLDTLIAGYLAASYGVHKAVAQQLVGQGWILPILDGLDEMDPDGAEPVLAVRLVRMLNRPVGPSLQPVVVTCRRDRYEQLSNHTARSGTPDIVQDATVVSMQPLTTDQVVQWLAHRFPDPRLPDHLERRWQPVVRRVRQRPTGALARCLASPLHLYLAVKAYQPQSASPRELLTVPAEHLNNHLLDQLIPSVAAQYATPGGDYYDANKVTNWLAALANHLAWMGKHGGSETDLNLPDLWRTGGRRDNPSHTVRYMAGLIQALIAVLLLSAYVVSRTHLGGQGANSWLVWSRLFTGVMAFVGVFWAATREQYDVWFLDLTQLRTSNGRRRLLDGVGTGFTIGLSLGVLFELVQLLAGSQSLPESLVSAPVTAVVLGLPIALIGGPILGLRSRRTIVDRPSRVTASILLFDAAAITAVGLASGAVFGIYLFSTKEFILWFVAGLFGGFVLRAWSPWPRYLMATIHMAKSGRLPARPGTFLDWAHEVGLLRLSGTSIQFRHVELQAWLTEATMPDTGTSRVGPRSNP